LIVTDDALGLETMMPMVLQQRQIWRFNSDANKVKAYRRWLKQQVNAGILTPEGGIKDRPWTAPYIESAYQKGVVRAYTDLNAAALAKSAAFYAGGEAAFIKEAFGGPIAQSKIELLYTRAFDELQGVTDAMGQQMSRILATGLTKGQGPKKIARELRKGVSSITKTRANVLVRTEIIRAHAEGQLDAFERLGVKEVGIRAEWSTAGDDKVCDMCGVLEGAVMTIDEARGLLPRHPNCRCMWIPANIHKKEKGQLWGKKKDKAVEESIQAEEPTGKRVKRTVAGVRRRSVWAGKKR
jgi:SPP1 gp7 family putative phage head morphogenesis protein